jgi:caa(3)-type oxidase subunit IV
MSAVPISARSTHVAFLALVALTVVGFAVRDIRDAHLAGVVILGAAGAKASLVGLQFMELRAAHLAWKLAFAAAVVGFVVAMWALRGGI